MEDFPVNSDYEQDVDLANLGENEGSQDLASSEQDEATRQAAEIEQRKVGAKVLAAAGFRGRHSETVDNSFDRADRKTLVGEKDERRVDAYLERIDAGIKEKGSRFEQKLWDQTMESLVIRAEDFPDSYWEAKKREYALRYGIEVDELPDEARAEYVKLEQDGQRVELGSWMDYLSKEPYPTWFKVYAIDGVSKMGISPSTGKYTKRRKGDVYAYPNFDAAILNEVYDAIADFYGLSGDTQHSPDDPVDDDGRTVRDSELEALVKSGNFAKLWAHFDSPDRVISTPEKAEDIHGEWIEYGLDQAEEISRAARGIEKGGQGWCIVSAPVARHYMARGEYGHLDDYTEEDRRSKGKFILFHLQDENGGKSSTACASIRLNVEGNVSEISGKCKGQALPESLLDVVEEKVKSLPGGEEFLPAFKDDKRLARLFAAYMNDEAISYEDLRFIHEIDRPIKKVGGYDNEYDERAYKLRDKYGIDMLVESCLATGADTSELINKLDDRDIAENIDKFVAAGIDIDVNGLVSRLDYFGIEDNLDKLLAAGADANGVMDKLSQLGFNIADFTDKLLAAGADANGVMNRLSPTAIAFKLDKLLAAGAKIDIDGLVRQIDDEDIARNLDELLAAGVDVNDVINRLSPTAIAYHLDKLIAAGAIIDIDGIVRQIDDNVIACNLDKLLAAGAKIDVDSLVRRLDSTVIVQNLDKLLAAGAKININSLVRGLDSRDIVVNLDELIAIADVNELMHQLDDEDIVYCLDKLIAAGAKIDVDSLVRRLDSTDIAYHLDRLIAAGAKIDVNELMHQLDDEAIVYNLAKLIAAGAKIDVNELIHRLDYDDVADNKESLLAAGADEELIRRRLGE